MSLRPGTRLGPYEITAPLGEGGMGKVWRAHHTALKRDDALKVLPDAFALDPDRLARFRREAQVLASLNHPNIAHVYGLEQSDGVQALVMELVEGPTLADRIAQGPIPVDESLRIAKQIAEALETAHEQGIIHRDLKPANIKLRRDGVVKVLDFGLAKALEPVSPIGADMTASPTITSPAMMTGVGVLLGTAAYMSPEQARGRPVDKRTDIWAFGCVLYEMLTGTRAFEDEDVTLTLSKVLQREPDFGVLPNELPGRIPPVLSLCLRKDPKQRAGDIRDVRLAIEGAFESSPPPVPSMVVRGAGSWRPLLVVAIAALVLGATVAGMAVRFLTRSNPPSRVQTEIGTFGEATLSVGGVDRDLAITPDGTRVAYRAAGGLFLRALDQLEPVLLAQVEAPRNVFVSPDGRWVGFFARDSINRVAITGGPPVTITALGVGQTAPRGATWGLDETIVFATSSLATGLQRVSAQGGDTSVLTTPDRARGEIDHVWPEFLPGGRAVLFTILQTTDTLENAQIAVLDLQTKTHTVLIRSGHHAQYVPTGHLVYGAGSTLRAVAFDLERRAVVGTPVPVLDGLMTSPSGAVDAAISLNGTLTYVKGTTGSNLRRPVFVDRDGTSEPVSAIEADAYANVRLSPDGRNAMVSMRNDLWLYELDSGRRTRFTRDGSAGDPMAWDPSGVRLAYSSNRGGTASINAWVQPADGSGEPRQLTKLDGQIDVDWWSPDGRVLALHQHRPDGGQSMLMLRMDTDSPAPELFVEDEPWAEGATFSPDGRYVAYMSSETGRREVYIRTYPRSGGKTPVSTGGGREVLWARTGELFYRTEDGDRMMAVTVTTQPTLRVGNPRELFAGHYSVNTAYGPRPLYDVTKDGRRFLMLQDVSSGPDEPAPPRIIVVQHWADELKRLVPN
jgi:serine/threonine-protein kinase